MITGELKSQVDKIWETFWSGGIANPLTVIEQFTYLLFIRRLDEMQLLEEKKANTVGIPIQDEIFTPAQKQLRWSSFKNKDPLSMFDLFTKPLVEEMTVFDHMKQVGHSAGIFADFMKNANFIIATPKLLDQVVQLIDKIDMKDRDTKGDLYEYMLSKIASAGTNGQFRTPRNIIRMMVDMVQPKKDEIICDPSSGTAGFLSKVDLPESFYVMNGDTFFSGDFSIDCNTSTIFVSKENITNDVGYIRGKDGKVECFMEKDSSARGMKLVSIGIYKLFKKDLDIPNVLPISMEYDILPRMKLSYKILKIEKFDIGTPERLEKFKNWLC